MARAAPLAEKVVLESTAFRRHADFPMFAVSEDGQVIGARGFPLNPLTQPSGHKHVAYFDSENVKRYILSLVQASITSCPQMDKDPIECAFV